MTPAVILATFDRIERERKHGPEQTGLTIKMTCAELRLPHDVVSQAVVDMLTGGAG